MQTRYPFLLFSAFVSVFYASDVWAATCTATPECASLGYKYSQEECPRGGLKCPTGDGYYCPTPRPKCNIGDIFYTDNTCVAASNHDSSKTVLGIVVYVTDGGQHGQIMAPWWLDKNGNRSSSCVGMEWGPKDTDILELPNVTSVTSAKADFDSCGYTDKIVAAGNADTYPAAWATRKYAPTSATSGKWCLPAAGVLRNIQENWGAISTVVNKVGGASDLGTPWVWSSSEFSNDSAWYAYFDIGRLGPDNKNYHYGCVVPVLEF